MAVGGHTLGINYNGAICWGTMRNCPHCGQSFLCDSSDYAYKMHTAKYPYKQIYLCSWHCLRAQEQKITALNGDNVLRGRHKGEKIR